MGSAAEAELDREQKEILRAVKDVKDAPRWHGRAWAPFRGDAVERIVTHHLERHLPPGFRAVRGAWVEGSPFRFDVLVVDRGAEPVDLTGAYPKDRVHVILEVKATGIWYKAAETVEQLREYVRKRVCSVGKPVLYLSLYHSRTYAPKVRKALPEITRFVLQIGKRPCLGEWARLLRRVQEILGS